MTKSWLESLRPRVRSRHGQVQAQGARRAKATGDFVASATDWVWPHWLERQARPASPAFVPSPDGLRRNLTNRDHTLLGAIWGEARPMVDRRGLVTTGAGWSVDFWAGGDDRWYMPSVEPSVRQSIIDHAPVVETTMRIPGGDLTHRAWVGTGSGSSGNGALVVEITNDSPVPVALAIGLRPFDLEGVGGLGDVEIEGRRMLVDGREVLRAGRDPARIAVGSLVAGDAGIVVLAGNAVEPEGPMSVGSRRGLASAAMVFPLPHTASVRFVVAIDDHPLSDPADFADSDAVAAGWAAQMAVGAKATFAEDRLAAGVESSLRSLSLAHVVDDLNAGPGAATSPLERAVLARALTEWGFSAPMEAVTGAVAASLRMDGTFECAGRADEANAATLGLLADHARFGSTVADGEMFAGAIARSAHRLAKRTAASSGWTDYAIASAIEALEALDQPDAAALLRSSGHAGVRADADFVTGLASSFGNPVAGPGLVDGSMGSDLAATSAVAIAELSATETGLDGLARLQTVVAAGGPTFAWPSGVSGSARLGSGRRGHDLVVSALVLLAARRVLVSETADGLALAPVFDPAHYGRGVEVHGLRTSFGSVSFALRWHGERPALLWEITPFRDGAAPVLTSPMLDPEWSSTDLVGETLLAVPPAPPTTADDEGEIDAPDTPRETLLTPVVISRRTTEPKEASVDVPTAAETAPTESESGESFS